MNFEIVILFIRFWEKYIGDENSLFSEIYYLLIIEILWDVLEIIDKYMVLKDIDYWDFYDVIEKFLFGELYDIKDGKIWGFNNFYSVWEGMCLIYLFK